MWYCRRLFLVPCCRPSLGPRRSMFHKQPRIYILIIELSYVTYSMWHTLRYLVQVAQIWLNTHARSPHPAGSFDQLHMYTCTCASPRLAHRSITPKFVTPTALSCIDNIIYTRWSSRRYELGCDTPVASPRLRQLSTGPSGRHVHVAAVRSSPAMPTIFISRAIQMQWNIHSLYFQPLLLHYYNP